MLKYQFCHIEFIYLFILQEPSHLLDAALYSVLIFSGV